MRKVNIHEYNNVVNCIKAIKVSQCMINLFYFYVTGVTTDLFKVSQDDFIGYKSPHQKQMDLCTFSFIYRIRYTRLTKIKAFKTQIIEAFFMSEDEREYYSERFTLLQRCYWAFTRLARTYKLKRVKRFDIDCDLCTTPFSALPTSILIDIYDKDAQTMYRFRLSDLMSLANCALTNAPDFFAHPLPLRNPYTNVPFTKAQLYNIYFAIKKSNLAMSTLFHLWFTSNFNLKLFLLRNECILVNAAIRDFIKNGSNEEWLEQIYGMLQKYFLWVNVSNGFPKDILVKVLFPYLHDYLIASYSLSPTLRKHAELRLQDNIHQFRTENPNFGRKFYRENAVHFIGAN